MVEETLQHPKLSPERRSNLLVRKGVMLENSGRFDEEAQLIQAAIEVCPPGVLLIRGDRIVLSPQPILIGPRSGELNDITRRYEEAADNGGEKEARSLSREWQRIKETL
jgi:hypothetical protein